MASARANNSAPGSMLRLPSIPNFLLNEEWGSDRKTAPLLGYALKTVKYLFYAMCAIHVHGKDSMATASILRLVQNKYRKLCDSFTTKYPNAVIGPFLKRLNRTTQELVNGKSVWAAAGRVRKSISAEYTPVWKSCLDNGGLPSGRDWDWVRKRTLVLLFRKYVSVNSKFKAVPERPDVDEEFKDIVARYPMWGVSLPYAWLAFMTFGWGIKCANASGEPHAWTLTSVSGLNRRNASRAKQRLHSDAERREKQREANARHRAATGMFILCFILCNINPPPP